MALQLGILSEFAVADGEEDPQRTPVADNEEPKRPTAVAGGNDEVWTDAGSAGSSVAGDTVIAESDHTGGAEQTFFMEEQQARGGQLPGAVPGRLCIKPLLVAMESLSFTLRVLHCNHSV